MEGRSFHMDTGPYFHFECCMCATPLSKLPVLLQYPYVSKPPLNTDSQNTVSGKLAISGNIPRQAFLKASTLKRTSVGS